MQERCLDVAIFHLGQILASRAASGNGGEASLNFETVLLQK
jgi:hypothetical protein